MATAQRTIDFILNKLATQVSSLLGRCLASMVFIVTVRWLRWYAMISFLLNKRLLEKCLWAIAQNSRPIKVQSLAF